MKRVLWFAGAVLIVIAAFAAVAQLVSGSRALASYFPDNALLYIEAKDFHALLKDWNDSEEKKAWIKGEDYAAFSRSHLFERLGGAQREFASVATIATDSPFLSSVAGGQSALALYDIGNLEFVYVTRMSEAQAQSTPLWQVRDKFEARTEGTMQFYVRQDQQSNRTAAFAVRDGWLILGTRADLVAGVLDLLQLATTRSLADEPWYADSIKQASGSGQDMRMVLNLERIVPSPHFRSYWVERNITEMKQYRAALCDLHRGSEQYTEDRVLLRKVAGSALSGGVEPLLALVPADAVFASAQASLDVDRVITELRGNVLEMKATEEQPSWSAPVSTPRENAGNAALLEDRIDVAPVMVKQTDSYDPLRALLETMQPVVMLKAYATRTEPDAMFVGIDRGMVLEAPGAWNEGTIQAALAAAIRPGLTVSQLGLGWNSHAGGAGRYFTLDGEVSLAMAVRDHRLFLTTSAPLMQAMLEKEKAGAPSSAGAMSYAAIFHHSPKEREAFRKIALRLDAAGHTSTGSGADSATNLPGDASGQAPTFFTGNIASLSRMFGNVASERVEERDEGAEVKQKVVYEWQHRSSAHP